MLVFFKHNREVNYACAFFSNIFINDLYCHVVHAATNSSEKPKLANEQVLNIGNTDDPKHLIRQKCNESTCNAIIKQLFEGLVTTDLSGNIIPASAENGRLARWENIYLYLRKNLYWSDKSLLVLKILFTFSRLVDPKQLQNKRLYSNSF